MVKKQVEEEICSWPGPLSIDSRCLVGSETPGKDLCVLSHLSKHRFASWGNLQDINPGCHCQPLAIRAFVLDPWRPGGGGEGDMEVGVRWRATMQTHNGKGLDHLRSVIGKTRFGIQAFKGSR